MSAATRSSRLVRNAAVASVSLMLSMSCGEEIPELGGGALSDAAAPSTTPPPGSGGSILPGADAGTGNSPVGLTDGGVPGEWCKVKPLFDKYCTTCHDGEGSFGSPMGLTTHADLMADSFFPGQKTFERVGVRIHDTANPMPPQGEISAADMATLDAWIAAGAPGSDSETCTQAPEPDGGVVSDEWPADCDEKYKLLANDGSGGKYSVRPGGQFYQDFFFDPPWTGEVHGVAFKAVVDNKRVLHHYILYQDTGAFLVGWSPGKNDQPLPPDVGLFLPGSGQMKMTVHYYNATPGAVQEADASGIEICVTKKKRPKTSAVMPFTAVPSVPGNTQRVENTSTCTVSGATEPVHIITSSPHMHQLGIHAKFTVKRANGQVETIHDKPFNFEEQTTWPIDFVVNNGDQITTTCVYRNTSGTQVGFGLDTEDEMCFNFAQYYPMCGMTCVPSNPVAAIIQTQQGGGCPSTGSGGTGGGGFIGGLLGGN